MSKRFVTVTLVLAVGVMAPSARAATPSCESLSALALTKAKVTSAQTVAAGAFTPPADLPPWMTAEPSLYKSLPAFCRVMVTATPSADSDIKIDVWMPVSGWNGKLRGQDNGGFAGMINYRSMAAALGGGYATAGTDTGHSGSPFEAKWALGHPEKVVDFGYRAIHEMTLTAKASVKAFYGNGPKRSYFSGCSNGGRQGLMEAQRFPEDYDGILVGAPANHWTHLLTSALWDAQVTTADEASYIPSSKLPAIARAVDDTCDGQDGVKDGVVSDPRRCRFDPVSLACKSGDDTSCLTTPQVTALQKLYQGARQAGGARIFPGFLPGAEGGPGGWGTWITGAAPGQALLFVFGHGYFANMVYEKPEWSYKTASLTEALKAAEDKHARTLDATDPNLKPFKDRGGKLILWHGWNDPGISALNSVDYYEGVVAAMRPADVGSFMRLYMAPGVQHCSDGPGPNLFGQTGDIRASDPAHSMQIALEKWVEDGIAPAGIVATRYQDGPPSDAASRPVDSTRPLCPYPQAAVYKGTGDTKDASNFTCASR